MSGAEFTDPFIGTVIDGRYRILSKLGEGGMGCVYRGEQMAMDRPVAIKMLRRDLGQDETLLERFKREAMSTSELEHPNTVTVFDFGRTSEGDLYLVMELLRGGSLGDVIGGEPMAPLRAIHIARQVARSAAEAHKKNLVHRDLKPANIQVMPVEGDPDFVKVLDFGLAKLRTKDEASTDQSLTQAGAALGTPLYMSPEQCAGQKIDGRTDIYALGVIIHEMLTGRPPFVGESSVITLTMHIRDPVPPLTAERPDLQFPRALQDVIFRCLEKKPDDRFATMDDVVAALDAARRTETGESQAHFSGINPVASSAGAAAALASSPNLGMDETVAPESGKFISTVPNDAVVSSVGLAQTVGGSSDSFEAASSLPGSESAVESAIRGEISQRTSAVGASTQAALEAVGGRKAALPLLVGGLVATLVIAAGWFLTRGGPPAPPAKAGPAATAPAATAPAAPAAAAHPAAVAPSTAAAPAAKSLRVRVRITGEPAGALVRIGGRLAGIVPTEYDLQSAEPVPLQVTKEGYKPFERDIDPAAALDGVLEIQANLQPEEGAPKAKRRRAKKKRGKKKRGKKKKGGGYEEFGVGGDDEAEEYDKF